MKKLIKRILAIATALALLEMFCLWYYNPAQYEWDEYRATDNIRQQNKLTSRATEGIAYSVTDAYGYNNAEIPDENGVSILMMGSSHMEGYNVMQDETIAALLQNMLADANYAGRVYNIGTSSHTITRNIANLERALQRFAPKDYVVIETAGVLITETEIQLALTDGYERLPKTDVGLPDWISGRALFATLYKQWMSLKEASADETVEEFVITDEVVELYRAEIGKLLEQAARTAEAYGVELIIFYHPHLSLAADGSAIVSEDMRCRDAFAQACAENGITYVDMTADFLFNYETTRILPHGFINTAPETGHLNVDGNRMIAQALSAAILGEEATK